MKYLEKLIPAHDKLKHFYLGALAFALLTVYFKNIEALFITFFGAFLFEIYQKMTGGTNSHKEMALDIFFGILLGVLVTIVKAL